MSRTSKKFKKNPIAFVILLFVIAFLVWMQEQPNKADESVQSEPETLKQQDTMGHDLTVHFIDVGQGDSCLLESDGHYMLVDAGENSYGDDVADYLITAGVTTLDYCIGTHPHSDHIGGLDTVIEAFDVDKVILPEVSSDTVTFEDVLTAVSDKGMTITKPVVGDSYQFGNCTFEIISPGKDYGDQMNNWSVGIKVICGNKSFLLCGDAETPVEKDMIESQIDLSADVLKVSHHGADSASSDEFLDAVSPTFAVISCGVGNQYGHPAPKVMEKLESRNIEVYRTDEQGTIIVTCDGENLEWRVETK